MANKLGKFLLFTAAVGTAAVAGYHLGKKKETDSIDWYDDDEDFDDFDDLPDEEEEEENDTRSYVPLNQEGQSIVEDVASEVKEAVHTAQDFFQATKETVKDSVEGILGQVKADHFTPLSQTARQNNSFDSKTDTEDFFDEDDAYDADL